MYDLHLQISPPHRPLVWSLETPLDEELASTLLLNGQCHVDHEGFDINEIEQRYHKQAGVLLTKDDTWYKDGGGDRATTAVLQPWIEQTNSIDYDAGRLIVDHSHFVYKFPIKGAAEQQVRSYAKKRPQLLRIVSSNFKCGLDLCVDILVGDQDNARLEPVFHIEWDFANYDMMEANATQLAGYVASKTWIGLVDTILEYNQYAKRNNVSAFEQADFRANLVFGQKAYRLIPTL